MNIYADFKNCSQGEPMRIIYRMRGKNQKEKVVEFLLPYHAELSWDVSELLCWDFVQNFATAFTDRAELLWLLFLPPRKRTRWKASHLVALCFNSLSQ